MSVAMMVRCRTAAHRLHRSSSAGIASPVVPRSRRWRSPDDWSSVPTVDLSASPAATDATPDPAFAPPAGTRLLPVAVPGSTRPGTGSSGHGSSGRRAPIDVCHSTTAIPAADRRPARRHRARRGVPGCARTLHDARCAGHASRARAVPVGRSRAVPESGHHRSTSWPRVSTMPGSGIVPWGVEARP